MQPFKKEDQPKSDREANEEVPNSLKTKDVQSNSEKKKESKKKENKKKENKKKESKKEESKKEQSKKEESKKEESKKEQSKKEASNREKSTVVLMALDASANAILSFGRIGKDAEWAPGSSGLDNKKVSAGFIEAESKRYGNSWPRVTMGPAAPKPGDPSTYEIEWDLDPSTLAGVIDRRNPAIPPTAKFPKIFRIAILYDGIKLPFEKNNFGSPALEYWRTNDSEEQISFKPEDISDMKLSMIVNGFDDMHSDYVLKRVYKVVLDTDDYDVDTQCTMLEFEMS
jgi:flagellar biosynthesis GTPase FlhF